MTNKALPTMSLCAMNSSIPGCSWVIPAISVNAGAAELVASCTRVVVDSIPSLAACATIEINDCNTSDIGLPIRQIQKEYPPAPDKPHHYLYTAGNAPCVLPLTLHC